MNILETRYLYMSYGMNTNRRAMEARCPLAKPMGGFYLPNYRLVFRGVADIVPEDGGVVPVVLWSITGKCLQALDRLEGYPHLYTRRKINHGWLTYMMQDKTQISKPNHNYYRMIEEGYKDFGLDDGALSQASDDAGGDFSPATSEMFGLILSNRDRDRDRDLIGVGL